MKRAHDIIVLSLAACLVVGPLPVYAAPQGGKVAAGSASISQSGSTTTIDQSSNRAVINWHSFDIGKNEAVHHNMPSAHSAALHRVVGGGGASQLEGVLKSNGNIYLVNPAGVVIHQGARINTNSFMATSRDISNDNFMRGKMVFDTPGRPDAHVINEGTITVGEKGLAALVAPTVRNDGVIAGKLAKVALASGNAAYTLDMYGDNLITFAVSDADVNGLYAADGTPLSGNAVTNAGAIKTDGGVVVLTSSQLDGIVGSVVNTGGVEAGEVHFIGQGSKVNVTHSGTVSVASATGNGGVVRMDTDGNLAVSGAIDARGADRGGSVTLTGETVALNAGASVNTSGSTGGGTVLVGGNALGKGPERNARTTSVAANTTIKADAAHTGDGGQVVVWSDGKTTFDGSITAQAGAQGGNGGKVETSGHTLKIGGNAYVSTSAPKGNAGMWLLDPVNITIGDANSDLLASTLTKMLQLNDVEIYTDNSYNISYYDDNGEYCSDTIGVTGNGDIIVNKAINIGKGRLTLNADNNIIINSVITLNNSASQLYIMPSKKLTGNGMIQNAYYFLDDRSCVIHEFSFKKGSLFSISSMSYKNTDVLWQDSKTIEDKQQLSSIGSGAWRHNWLSRDRERGGDELSLLVDEIAVSVAAMNADMEAENDAETGEGVRLDAGDTATAVDSGLAAYFREKARVSMTAAQEIINRDQSSMNDQKRAAAMDNLGEVIVCRIAEHALSRKGGGDTGTGFSDVLESAMVDVPEGLGRKLLQQSFGSGPGAESPVILHAAGSGVDERVVASLNKALGGVFNAIARAGAGRGGTFVENASATVAEALKNDEQLQRYIDLYNYYVTEKMSLAGAIMG